MIADLVVALTVLTVGALPVAYSFVQDARALRVAYHDALAMELLDGEMEVLVAGAWRGVPEGTNEVRINSPARTNLPPGRFLSVRRGQALQLQWQPAGRHTGRPLSRAATVH